jgi:cbb3-type cytochrome oxidase maturation protein
MESLYLLIPLSVLLVLGIAGILVWAVLSGQFERLDDAGARILRDEPDPAEPLADDDGIERESADVPSDSRAP